MADLITIVTVVKNDAKNIEKTILSVLSQNYPSIEYIIIDGVSTDQTLSVINKYADKITLIISEPDINMFDAMNKAVKFANGKWINFMNSGDRFMNSNILSKIFSNDKNEFDLLYGDSIIEYQNGKTHQLKVNNQLKFWKRYINHQSTFIKTQLLKEKPFNITYDLCSDFDFLIRMYLQQKKLLYLNFPISIRSSGGHSDLNRINAHFQKGKILIAQNNRTFNRFNVAVFINIQVFKELLKSIIKFLFFRSRK
jgi:glycosyltransferase involved in cell wall biosynthesis